MAIMVTHISAAAGALMWSAIEWVKYGKPSALGIVTGMGTANAAASINITANDP